MINMPKVKIYLVIVDTGRQLVAYFEREGAFKKQCLESGKTVKLLEIHLDTHTLTLVFIKEVFENIRLCVAVILLV